MKIEEIFPTKLSNSLKRVGIETVEELKEKFNNIPKNFNGRIYRCLGEESYKMLEYFVKVELP